MDAAGSACPAPEDEVRLARVAGNGDPAARRELVERLMERVRNLARYLVRDPVEAEDAAQVAMIEILRSAARYRGESRLAWWADRITTRTALRHARRRWREARVVRLDGGMERAADGNGTDGRDGSPGDFLLRTRLARHLDRLNTDRREAVVLRLVCELSVDEIAEECAVSRNTVKDRLRVGLAELRQSILRDPALRAELLETMS